MNKEDIELYLRDIEGLIDLPDDYPGFLYRRNVKLALEQVQFLIKELENDQRREEQPTSTDS